jgi:hypothetical protein
LPLTTGVTGVLPVANGGTNANSAGITAFNNITGYTASGATGTTSTNLVFSTSPTLVTPALGVATATSLAVNGATIGPNALAITGTAAFSSSLSLGGGLSGVTTLAASGAITGTQSIGATSTDGLVLTNTTAASVGAQQWSPRLHFTGQGWKTTATAASQTVDFIQELQPVQGTANPTGNLTWSSQVNGAGYGALMTLTSSGSVGIGLTSPLVALDVNTQIKVGPSLNTPNPTNYTTLIVGQRPAGDSFATVRIGAASATRGWNVEVYDNGTNAQYFQIFDQVNTAIRVTINNSGYVGLGTTSPSQLLTLKSTGAMAWDNGSGTADLMLTRSAAATLQFGLADAAAPVAQTLQAQSVVAGTSNTSGVNTTINGSRSTGAGTSGDIIFQTGGTGAGATAQNALVAALTIKGATQLVYTNSATQILGSKTTITGGSTGNVPTLSAGPVTGNPTKWLPYDDNGTTRYIPAW